MLLCCSHISGPAVARILCRAPAGNGNGMTNVFRVFRVSSVCGERERSRRFQVKAKNDRLKCKDGVEKIKWESI